MDNHPLESTNKLLRVIVALLVRQKDKEDQSLKQQIGILSGLGLRPFEMAEILGKSSMHINKELSVIRKGRSRGK